MSQLVYVILLCDDQSRCHIIDFNSRKSRRVVRSILAGELYAFSDGFSAALLLKHDLERIDGVDIPLKMFTDFKQFFDVFFKSSLPTEKRLMIDLVSIWESYRSFEITGVGLIRGTVNIADAVTADCCNKALDQSIESGVDSTMV